MYIEPNFPELMFAIDGEVYNFNDKKILVIGGAYSVDKFYRLARGMSWFADEQPSEDTKKKVVGNLEKMNWKLDVVLSHTTPLKYEPVECFLPGIDQSTVDKTTEIWLDDIENRLDYKEWYCGHYHINKAIDKMKFLFEDVVMFKQAGS